MKIRYTYSDFPAIKNYKLVESIFNIDCCHRLYQLIYLHRFQLFITYISFVSGNPVSYAASCPYQHPPSVAESCQNSFFTVPSQKNHPKHTTYLIRKFLAHFYTAQSKNDNNKDDYLIFSIVSACLRLAHYILERFREDLKTTSWLAKRRTQIAGLRAKNPS